MMANKSQVILATCREAGLTETFKAARRVFVIRSSKLNSVVFPPLPNFFFTGLDSSEAKAEERVWLFKSSLETRNGLSLAETGVYASKGHENCRKNGMPEINGAKSSVNALRCFVRPAALHEANLRARSVTKYQYGLLQACTGERCHR